MNDTAPGVGQKMYALVERLFPICRSITGDGVRQTFEILQEYVPLEVHEVPTGTQVFDWTVPKEWNIRDAYVLDNQGNRIVDFKKSNLHVVNYSAPVDKTVTLAELEQHLYSLADKPDVIPYVTSYYKERWGFCMTHRQRQALREGSYRVRIDSDLKDGSLTYGELLIRGQSEEEVLISTYVCHPSMANNELSGPVVATFIARWLEEDARKYTYRIVFVPETIGSIVYISRNLKVLQRNTIAGFVLTCIGDEGKCSIVRSRKGKTLADKAALNVLSFRHPDFREYSYVDRGSDERQYCSPGVDLPVVSLMRSGYRDCPEHHTSLDNLDLVTACGLQGGFEMVRDCLTVIEENRNVRATCKCEPQLSKRSLYPDVNARSGKTRAVKTMMDLLAYADGTNDLIDISNTIGVPVWEFLPVAASLEEEGLLRSDASVAARRRA